MDVEQDPDRIAIERCRRRDHAGLAALYDRHGDRVYRLALHLLGQAADAEDATQEVFLRVYEKAHLFRGASRLTTWLWRLTANHCLNLRKRRKRPRSLADLAHDDHPPSLERSPEETQQLADERSLLLRLLDELPDDLRAILVLRELEGLSYREIADGLAVPIGTVMSRLARARQRLSEAAGARPLGLVTT